VSFFLIPQLITSTLEAAVNKLAKLDPTFTRRCQPLVGKQLMVEIEELKVPLTFVVGEQRISILSSKDEPSDCAIKTSLSALKELKDPNQITRLIKDSQLSLEGDIHLAQQVSQLIKETKIDWEEHLSDYLGDAMAHKIATRFKHFGELLASKNQDFDRIITELAQDEIKVAPHPAQTRDFSQKVNQTRAKVDKLAAKIAGMSAARKS
jgi:ubiquinone biosynthesis protein UbiJ